MSWCLDSRVGTKACRIPQLVSVLAKSPVFHILTESYYLDMWILMSNNGRPPAQESPIARLTCLLERWINAPSSEKSVQKLCDLFCEVGLNEFSRIIRENCRPQACVHEDPNPQSVTPIENKAEVIWKPEDILQSTDNPFTNYTENLKTGNIRSSRRSHFICIENGRCVTKDVIILILLMALVISILGFLVSYFRNLEFECNEPSTPSTVGVFLDHQNYSNMIYWPEAAGLILKCDVENKGEQLYLGSYGTTRINNHTYYQPGYFRRNKLSSSYSFFQSFIFRPGTLDNKTAVKVANLIPGLFSWVNASSVRDSRDSVIVGDILTAGPLYYYCRSKWNTTIDIGVVPGTTVPSSGLCDLTNGRNSVGITTTEYEILVRNALGRLITSTTSLKDLPLPTDDTYNTSRWDLYRPSYFRASSLIVAGFLWNSTSREHQWLYLARVYYQSNFKGQIVNSTSLGYLDPRGRIVQYVEFDNKNQPKARYRNVTDNDRNVQIFGYPLGVFSWVSDWGVQLSHSLLYGTDAAGNLCLICRLEHHDGYKTHLLPGMAGPITTDLAAPQGNRLCVAAFGSSVIRESQNYEVLAYNQLHDYRRPFFSGSLQR